MDMSMIIALGLFLAIFGALLAEHKGRGMVRWAILCALTGLVGLLVLACLPRRPRNPYDH